MRELSTTAEDARYIREDINQRIYMSDARRSCGGTEAVKNMTSTIDKALVGTKASVRSDGKKGTIEVNIDLGPFAITNHDGEAVHHYVRNLLDEMGYEFTGTVNYTYSEEAACDECYAVTNNNRDEAHHYNHCSKGAAK